MNYIRCVEFVLEEGGYVVEGFLLCDEYGIMGEVVYMFKVLFLNRVFKRRE